MRLGDYMKSSSPAARDESLCRLSISLHAGVLILTTLSTDALRKGASLYVVATHRGGRGCLVRGSARGGLCDRSGGARRDDVPNHARRARCARLGRGAG